MACIEIQNLSYRYGDRVALDSVTFNVELGQCCGLLGPNGSGKSTLFRILSTLVRPQTGEARIAGADVRTEPDVARRKIGVVFQSPSLDKRLTVAENLRCQGRLYGLSGRDLQRRITEMLDRFELADRAASMAGTLSGGQQRRVELAKGLLHKPEILLLDEPSTGLDPAARITLRRGLQRLRDEDKITMLLTTHILDEADHCDQIVILDKGRIIESGSPAQLKSRIAGDCVLVSAADLDGLAARIERQLGVKTMRVNDDLRIESQRGHELIARLIDTFGDEIRSVTFARPTLEDVFIDRTGHRLEAEAA